MSRKTGKGSQSGAGITPASLASRFDLALREHQRGKLDKARRLYEKILRAFPHHADALHMLGLLEHQSGNQAASIELFNRAIQAGASGAELYTNLGTALQASGNNSDAIAACRKAVALNPAFAMAHNNLGNALRVTGETGAALESFRQAIRLEPGYALGYYNLGDLFHATGRLDEAATSMKQALSLEPGFARACNSLATILMERGEVDEAQTLFERTLQLDAGNASARHLLAALKGETTETAPPGYVMGLFDGCAGYFERHLVDELEYRAPQDLHTAVSRLVGPGQNKLDVLDLGCGTGLCAAVFRDMAGTLTGVDLSSEMLERAALRRQYDRLVQGDITEELLRNSDAYDLIVSADVFIYVGALEAVFEAVAGALRPGGLFAFSIEAGEGDSYLLRPSGRYAQSLGYIRRLAENVGLGEISVDACVLRMDKRQPIHGNIVLLQRPE